MNNLIGMIKIIFLVANANNDERCVNKEMSVKILINEILHVIFAWSSKQECHNVLYFLGN